MNMSPSTVHLTDGDIVRLCDAEMSDDELVNTGAHLRTCDACRQRVEEFRDEAATVASWLRAGSSSRIPGERTEETSRGKEAAAPAGRVRRYRPIVAGLAAGAVVAGALAADPVRSWLGELIVPNAPPEAPVPAPIVEPAAPPVSTLGVGFTPTSDSLVVRFREPQETGVLRVEWTRQARVRAEVTNGGDETLVILPNGVQVLNAAGSQSDYRLSVPAGIRVVTVLVGGELVGRLSEPDAPEPVSVRLAPG